MVLQGRARARSWKAIGGRGKALKARRLAWAKYKKAGPAKGKPPVAAEGNAADTAYNPGKREPRRDPRKVQASISSLSISSGGKAAMAQRLRVGRTP